MVSRVNGITVRRVFIALIILTALMNGNVIAGEAKEKLKPGEAYVILRVSGNRVQDIRFQEFQGKNTFVGNYNSLGRLIKVKAGRYYLMRVQSPYKNVGLPVYPEPESVSDTLEIRESAVTYIGDWLVTEEVKERGLEYSVDVRYQGATVMAAVKKSDVTGLELLMARLGRPVVRMQLGEHEKKQE